MRNNRSSPHAFGLVNLPAAAATFVGQLLALAAIVAGIHSTVFPDEAFWKVYGMFVLSTATGELIYFFVLRPLRGQPPLFRRRPTDDFEEWMGRNGFAWSRLGERYSSDELLLLFGVIAVILFATMYWAFRM